MCVGVCVCVVCNFSKGPWLAKKVEVWGLCLPWCGVINLLAQLQRRISSSHVILGSSRHLDPTSVRQNQSSLLAYKAGIEGLPISGRQTEV